MTSKMKLGTLTLEIDFNRFGSVKIIIALSIIFLFVFLMGQQLVDIAEEIPNSKIKAGISFFFIIIGLMTFLEDDE